MQKKLFILILLLLDLIQSLQQDDLYLKENDEPGPVSQDSVCQYNDIWRINPCPDGFENYFDQTKKYCIKHLENVGYPVPCPFPQEPPAPFNIVEEYLKENKSSVAVWMPAKRIHRESGLDLIYWTDPTNDYLKVVQINSTSQDLYSYDYKSGLKGKDCLLYHSNSSFEAVNCNENHDAICIYEALNSPLHQSLCKQHCGDDCRQAMYESPLSCFCKENETNIYADFIHPYQNLLFLEDLDPSEECYFGLKRDNNNFSWVTSGKHENQLYFAENVSCDGQHIYGAFTSRGWILKSESPHDKNICSINQFKLNENDILQPPPNITLMYDEQTKLIILTVTNLKVFHHFGETTDPKSDDKVYCFTDACPKQLISKINIMKKNVAFDENRYVANLTTHVKGPGNYWCEGFIYPNLTLITSNKILVRQIEKFPAEYVAKLSETYVHQTNPITLTHINYIVTRWDALFSNTNLIPRIFTLDELDEPHNKLTFTLHITSNSEDHENEYEFVRKIISEQTDFTLLKYSVVDYCMGTTHPASNLNWTKTNKGHVVEKTVEGYCIDSNGKWASRRCSEDFINGAQWDEELNFNCTILTQSYITDKLFQYLKSENPSMSELEQNILIFSGPLEYIDLYFLFRIFEKFNIPSITNFDFVSVMNKIIENFPVTENPLPSLASMENILRIYKEYLSKNLKTKLRTDLSSLKLIQSKEERSGISYGVILRKFNEDYYEIKMAEQRIDVQYLDAVGNVDSALVFSEDQLNVTKLNFAVSVFLKKLKISGLSNDWNTKIYSFISDHDNDIRSPFLIYLNISHYSNNKENKCAFWHSESKWIISDPTVEVGNLCSNFMICTFPSISSYFTVTSTNETNNLTTDLLYLKESEKSTINKLKLVSVLVSEIAKLDVLGVKVVTDILEAANKCVAENVIDVINYALPIFTDIISNLMKIPKAIMMQAKTEANVPEKLLSISKNISKKMKQSDNDNENFNVIVSEPGKKTTRGFMYQKNCRPNCGLKEINNMEDLQNVEAAVLCDEKLMSQNFVLTAYSNDVLFSESYEKPRNVSKIFGLDVRDASQLRGKFSILYNVSSEHNHQLDNCVFWDSNSKKWVEENPDNPNSLNDLKKCEFDFESYFTLLTAVEPSENVTKDIEEILKSDVTPPVKIEQLVSISKKHKYFEAIDIYLVCQIFQESANCSLAHNIRHVSQIVDNLMKISRDTLYHSESIYQATDGILNCLDNIISNKNTTEQHLMLQETIEEKQTFIGDNFHTVIIDLNNTDVVGLAISRYNSKWQIEMYTDYKTIEELEKIDNFEAAVFLSPQLLKQVKSAPVVSNLIVTTFLKDALFNDNHTQTQYENTSTIFGVLLPDFDEEFEGPVQIFYNKKGHIPNSCAFWNFSVYHDLPGFWEKDGNVTEKTSKIGVCNFYHLTHFAMLLAGAEIDDKYHLLDIITLINCTLSLFGVLGIVLTAILFEKWRRNTGNKILLNFSLALTIKIGMLYVSSAVFDPYHLNSSLCMTCGAILHYALLSEFCWMLVIAILQFKRFVEVLGGPPKYVLLKACICGWVFPVFPILILLILDPDNYTQGHTALCYPTDLGLYLGVWLPIIIIVGINFVIFLYIIINVFVGQSSKNKETMNSEMLFQWRLALLLFFMLGLTWFFGFLGLLQNMYAFLYLFCFTATLQGFIMFLFFILFNQSTRMLYWHSFKLWLYSKNLIKL